MSTTRPFIFKSAGVLVFLATATVGWNLGTPSPVQVLAKESAAPARKHAPRRAPSPRAMAADDAAKRVAAVRAAGDPAGRMRATIDLANSLTPAEFAAWLEGGWFALRDGPEMKLFSKILMERWRQEDPEGLLVWGLKKGENAATHLAHDWAAKEPQRLLAFFKTHKDDRAELEALAEIAAPSPDLAMQRLREMVTAGMVTDAMYACPALVAVLAEKSPDALLAILDFLPAYIRTEALVAITKPRLATAFSEEIRNLWERPDGWELFRRCASQPDIADKLLAELPNMPSGWRNQIGANPGNWINPASARRWWDFDLEGAGFSAAEIHRIRFNALENMMGSNATEALQRMGEIDLTPAERASALANVFGSARDVEKARALIAGLPTEDERKAATLILDQRSKPKENLAVMTPSDYLARLAAGDVPRNGPTAQYLQTLALDSIKVSALAAGFKDLPADQKQKVAAAFASYSSGLSPHDNLRGDAIRYLVEHPRTPVEAGEEWRGTTANCSRFAVDLAKKDPAAASEWVDALPDGEAKLWARKNLAANWAQYDPKAVDQWLNTLPAGSRAEVRTHLKTR